MDVLINAFLIVTGGELGPRSDPTTVPFSQMSPPVTLFKKKLLTYVVCVIKSKFHLARHVSTKHVRHDQRDRYDLQLSLSCNLFKVMICKLFANLLESPYTLI